MHSFDYRDAYEEIHPKTLVRYGLLAWTRVSANSEKGIGSQWAVRVGQRLKSTFRKSGAARKLGLVQIVVEASAIRWVLQTLSRLGLFLVGAVAAFWGTVGRGWPSDRMDENTCKFLGFDMRSTLQYFSSLRSNGQPLFQGRWCRFDQPEIRALESGFWTDVSHGYKITTFRSLIFFQFYYTLQKNSFATPRTVLQWAFTRVPGLGQIIWWIVCWQKMRGHIRKNCTEIEK